MFSDQLVALEQGELLGVGFMYSGHEVVLPSSSTHVSSQLSNWYTQYNMTLAIKTNSSTIIEYALIDFSQPDFHFPLEGLMQSNFLSNYTAEFRLPYLFTDDGKVANWSLSFRNQLSVPVHLEYYVHAGMIEDSGIYEMAYIRYDLTLPWKLLLTFWVAALILDLPRS